MSAPSAKSRALKSAGLASARSSASYPRASPLASSSLVNDHQQWPRPHRHDPSSYPAAVRKGKAKAIKWIQRGEEDGDMGSHDEGRGEGTDLSSRDMRLSRAARFGSSRSSFLTFLPDIWDRLANDYIQKNHLAQLRSDYAHSLRDARGTGRLQQVKKNYTSGTTFLLAAVAPYRFTALRAILRQVRMRLGPDTEAVQYSEREMEAGWIPSRIVEYNCRASEGLWAAQEVFGTASFSAEEKGKRGTGISSYEGYTTLTVLTKLAMSFIEKSGQPSENSEAIATPALRKGEEASSSSEGAVHDSRFNGIQVCYKGHPNQPDAMHGSKLLPELKEGDNSVLVLSSYAMLMEPSDHHRRKYIRRLIEANPNGEVMVFVEEATERGFAAIASAREYLLGSDERDHQDQDKSKHPAKGDWHVVAPCPHDKPCPLLHDFELAEEPHVVPMRKSYASSPLFHGAKLDMNVCSFSARLHRPTYLQWTTQDTRQDEPVSYSYLVVKKGPRPGIAQRAKLSTSDNQIQMEEMAALRKRAHKTKGGILDELRAGTKRDAAPLGEEINDEGKAESMSDTDDATAREELLRILPEALKGQLIAASSSGKQQADESGHEDEAFRLAQELMGKSAALAKEAEEAKELVERQEGERDEETALASSFLDQVRALQQPAVDEDAEDATSLQSSDIEAMRLESTQWPRLIRTPIKRSGHVTFDVCSSHGSIDRFTVSKSMGKQIYQDARKSSQGDLFPHVPLSDDENTIFGHKSQVTRVPAASSTRGSLPGMFYKVYRKPGKTIPASEYLTASSAIGPDRVAYPTYKKNSHNNLPIKDDHQVQKLRERRGERAMKSKMLSADGGGAASSLKDRDSISFRQRRMSREQEEMSVEFDEPHDGSEGGREEEYSARER